MDPPSKLLPTDDISIVNSRRSTMDSLTKIPPLSEPC